MVKKMLPASQPTKDPYRLIYQILSINNTPTSFCIILLHKSIILQQNLNFLCISNLSFSCSYKHYHTTASIIISQSSSQGICKRGVVQDTVWWGPWVSKSSSGIWLHFHFFNQSTIYFSSKQNSMRTCNHKSKEYVQQLMTTRNSAGYC